MLATWLTFAKKVTLPEKLGCRLGGTSMNVFPVNVRGSGDVSNAVCGGYVSLGQFTSQ